MPVRPDYEKLEEFLTTEPPEKQKKPFTILTAILYFGFGVGSGLVILVSLIVAVTS